MGTSQILNAKPYRREQSRIVFSTEAPGLESHIQVPRNRMDPAEAKAQAEIKSVALAQPHRRGSESKRAGDPIAEYCEMMGLRDELYHAGCQYGEVCRQEKASHEFNVIGTGKGEGDNTLSEEQKQAIRDLSRIKYKAAREVLVGVDYQLPGRMELLCYDLQPPSPYNYDIIKRGLLRLAIHFGLLRLGINAEKMHAA